MKQQFDPSVSMPRAAKYFVYSSSGPDCYNVAHGGSPSFPESRNQGGDRDDRMEISDIDVRRIFPLGKYKNFIESLAEYGIHKTERSE